MALIFSWHIEPAAAGEGRLPSGRRPGELGISQALLSHYENGIREPGPCLFVVKACAYYHVSADFLLGRTLNRDGSIIEAEDVYAPAARRAAWGCAAATQRAKY